MKFNAERDANSEQDARDLHGNQFVDELAAEFNLQDVKYSKTFRERAVQKLHDLMESNMAFWIAGFVDGLLVYAFVQYLVAN